MYEHHVVKKYDPMSILTGKLIRLGSAIALKLEDTRIGPGVLVRLTNTDPVVTRSKVIQGINL